jgi:hypothetical protein
MQDFLESFEYEGDLLNDFDELIEDINEPSTERLLIQAKKCSESSLHKSAMISLWCAASEQLKNFLLSYDFDQLSRAKCIPGDISSRAELDDIGGKELLRGAGDIGLLSNSELPMMIEIYNLRNSCAHGDDEEVGEKEIAFALGKLREGIFSKWEVAGVNAEALIRVVESTGAPKKFLEAAEDFSVEEQSRLISELYSKRKTVPNVTTKARDNYLKSDEYTRQDAKERDRLIDSLDILWPKMKEDVRKRFAEKAKTERFGNRKIQQFLISYGLEELTVEEQNEVLEEFLEDKSSTDHETQDDVAMTLVRAPIFRDLSESVIHAIWEFCRSDFGPSSVGFEPETTRKHYRNIVNNMDSSSQEKLIAHICENIESVEERTEEETIEEYPDLVLSDLDFEYLKHYLESFDDSKEAELLDCLENSSLTEVSEIEKFVERYS